jgi:hypothetical protein
MFQPKEYDCVHRFIGECVDCRKDEGNYHCPRYYPVHVVGSEGIIQRRELAKELTERCQRK